MVRQKGIATLLIVLLIALAVAGYLLYQKQAKSIVVPQPVAQSSPSSAASPVPNGTGETANWKTYTSVNCGFSFKYPEKWETYSYGHTPNEEPLDYCGPSLAEERFLKPIGLGAASIDLQISPLKNTAYDYLEKSFKESLEAKNININGVNGLSKITYLPNGKRLGSALFKNGNYVYQLGASDENSIDVLYQILSTFKFQ